MVHIVDIELILPIFLSLLDFTATFCICTSPPLFSYFFRFVCSSHAADNVLDPVYKPEMPRESQIRRRGKRGRDPFIDRWSQPFL
jgi:hypothetical protein